MSHKKKILYQKIFKFLRDNFKITPRRFMCDYEASLRIAAKTTWNNCEILGCWFHYTQAITRKMKSIHELALLRNNNYAAMICFKLFMNLPLLPQNKIQEGFEEIISFQEENNFKDTFEIFNNYFVQNWLSSLTSYENIIHRTNNVNESFNAKIKRKIGRRPSTFKFLGKLTNLIQLKYHQIFNFSATSGAGS